MHTIYYHDGAKWCFFIRSAWPYAAVMALNHKHPGCSFVVIPDETNLADVLMCGVNVPVDSHPT